MRNKSEFVKEEIGNCIRVKIFLVAFSPVGSAYFSSKRNLLEARIIIAFKLDFKQNCTAASGSSLVNNTTSSLGLSPVSPDSQQFNIFPAIFSRQLNFSAGNCNQQKFMIHNSMADDLRPNLVGGLLGLQQGLIDDHSQIQHNNSESKFMSLQDNHNRYENRLLGLSQDSRNSSLSALAGSNLNISNGNDSNKASIQRKCSSTPEDFNSIYGTAIDNPHHHTPAHTPPNRLNDHNSITGEFLWIVNENLVV